MSVKVIMPFNALVLIAVMLKKNPQHTETRLTPK